jgi:hypothetical protein
MVYAMIGSEGCVVICGMFTNAELTRDWGFTTNRPDLAP